MTINPASLSPSQRLTYDKVASEVMHSALDEEPAGVKCCLCNMPIYKGEFYIELDDKVYCDCCIDEHTKFARWE